MDSEDKRAVGKKQKWSDSYTQYWINHTNCELCYGTASAPAHIKSRGAGGSDSENNLLSLCLTCHTKQHRQGWGWVISQAPFLKEKIQLWHQDLMYQKKSSLR